MERGPVAVARGPVAVARGPVAVARGPVAVARGPVAVATKKGRVKRQTQQKMSHQTVTATA